MARRLFGSCRPTEAKQKEGIAKHFRKTKAFCLRDPQSSNFNQIEAVKDQSQPIDNKDCLHYRSFFVFFVFFLLVQHVVDLDHPQECF